MSSQNTSQHVASYADTHHALSAASVLSRELEDRASTKHAILEDDSTFVLENLLTSKECEAIKTSAEIFGMEDIAAGGYSRLIRSCERTAFVSVDIATTLFDRAKDYLKEIHIDGYGKCTSEQGIQGLRSGRWVPYGLNPCFRVVKYEAGGFFLPHFDGGHCVLDGNRSIKTFMMYLSASGKDFEGGPTSIYDGNQRHYARPDPANAVAQYFARKGSCIVMNHKICHDGGYVESGEKWLLRSEVMYKWVGPLEEQSTSLLSDEEMEGCEEDARQCIANSVASDDSEDIIGAANQADQYDFDD